MRKIKTRGGHIKMIKNPYNGLKRNRTLLKFGDVDGPNLCRVNKVDIRKITLHFHKTLTLGVCSSNVNV